MARGGPAVFTVKIVLLKENLNVTKTPNLSIVINMLSPCKLFLPIFKRQPDNGCSKENQNESGEGKPVKKMM